VSAPRRWIRRLLRLPDPDNARLAQEVEAEIDLHLELRTEQLVREGLSPAVAREEALRRFGQVGPTRDFLRFTSIRRERRVRIRGGLMAVGQDTVHAIRGIIRERVLSLVVISTLAIGIGANAAVFGLVDRLLLTGPEHVRDADRVTRLYVTDGNNFGSDTSPLVPYPMYEAVRDRVPSFDEVAVFSARGTRVLGGGGDGEDVQVAAASWNLFPLLGVQARLGRFFAEDEDRPPQGENVAVLGHSLWRRRYGADPATIGSTVRLGSIEYTIIGVAPPQFTGPQFEAVDAWVPLSASGAQARQWTAWSSSWLQVIGRLGPGATLEGAGAEADAAFRDIYDGSPSTVKGGRVSVAPIRYDSDGREPLEAGVSRWLLAVSLTLLLIACANVASLHLARSVRSERELAVRLALGSGRGRLIRSSVIRSLILASMGGAVALLVASWTSRLLRRLLAPTVAWEGAPVDTRVFVFAFLTTVATALLIGLIPAIQGSRRDLVTSLHAGSSARGVRHARVLGGLTVAQTTAATVLLIGAGLFARSLGNVLALPLGIDADNVWIATPVGGGAAAANAFYASVLDRIEGHPAVESAAVSIGTPFWSTFGVSVEVPGFDSLPDTPGGGPYVSAVSRGYFATVGTRLLRGRLFTPNEGAGTEPVVLVNETMASVLWPGEDPLQKCVILDWLQPPCARVVGVVEDSKRSSVHDDPALQWYLPLGQEEGISGSTLLIRASSDDDALPEIRAVLQEVAGSSSFLRMTPLAEQLDPEIRPWRAGATLFSMFGALALAVAAFGLYGVVAYNVAQRTREIGLRMALGARAAQVGSMVLRQALSLVLVGLFLGLLLVMVLGRLIEPALFAASPRDPEVMVAVALVLLLVAGSAALVPSLRAAATDPLMALRAE
jgi:predicted permease